MLICDLGFEENYLPLKVPLFALASKGIYIYSDGLCGDWPQLRLPARCFQKSSIIDRRMWKEWKEIVAWFRGTEEASTPDQSAVDGLMRLVAATTMASLHEAQQRQNNPPHLSDAAPPPSEREEQAAAVPPKAKGPASTQPPAKPQSDKQPPPGGH